MNRIVWTGVTITALSLSTVAGWKAWFNSRSWTLIDDVPISLAKGIRYSSHVLPVNVSQQYAIQVHVSNNLAPEILRCQLGTGSRQNPCDPPSPFRVHWVLSSEGRIVQEGWDTPDDLGELSAGTTESSRFIALFKLKNGHRYKIDLDVLSDSANLNVTDPHLYFGEFDTVLEFDLVVSGLLRVVCTVIAGIGALLAIWGLYEGQRVRAMRHLATQMKDASAADEDVHSRD